MTCYKLKCSHWWKYFYLKLNAVISVIRGIESITGHMVYNPAYN